jgi:hypothetical protein
LQTVRNVESNLGEGSRGRKSHQAIETTVGKPRMKHNAHTSQTGMKINDER